METALAALVGIFIATAAYLLLSRSLVRLLLGVVVLGNGINLLIFVAGRLTRGAPPILASAQLAPIGPIANPLPQALILTAIVIGFALFVFLLALVDRIGVTLKTSTTDALRAAEPPAPREPLSY